ncbi:MAG TPA: polyprenyl diphosphate synthase [Candidatus Paceibacterota bacterium]|nr:polyprenyl diphosphate synthase [Candidatus Paceibacterota bacterium]
MEERPACVGFIMDGNRRWARERGLPTLEGHRAGYETLKSLVRTARRERIPHVVCYAFSTENWRRPEDEVSYLMDLMGEALAELAESMRGEDGAVNVRVIGDESRLTNALRDGIRRAEAKNESENPLTVWVALSYGGRAEIVEAANRVRSEDGRLDEASFERFLWSGEMPDPDLIVRTGGEKRLSNFLLWKASYSELFFSDTLWPDFGDEEFRSILDEYGKRQRRRGA